MSQAPLRLIEKWTEFQPQKEFSKLPGKQRGLYVLYKKGKNGAFNVVYIGMASAGSIRVRIRSHSKKKAGYWTHFSAFKVWDNIRDDEITELEGLFRHIYRLDSHVNRLNKQKKFIAELDSR